MFGGPDRGRACPFSSFQRIPPERISERVFEQVVDVPGPRVLKRLSRVIQLIQPKRTSERIVVDVPSASDSDSSHPGACNAFGVSKGVIHSKICRTGPPSRASLLLFFLLCGAHPASGGAGTVWKIHRAHQINFPLVFFFSARRVPSSEQTVSSHCCLVSMLGLSDHRHYHHQSTRHLQRLDPLSLRTICVSITVSLSDGRYWSCQLRAQHTSAHCSLYQDWPSSVPRWACRVGKRRLRFSNQDKESSHGCSSAWVGSPSVFTRCPRRGYQRVPLPRRPGLAIGFPSCVELAGWESSVQGAGRGQCPWPRFDLFFSCSQEYLLCWNACSGILAIVLLRVCSLSCGALPVAFSVAGLS